MLCTKYRTCGLMCTHCGRADEAGEAEANGRGSEARGKRSRLSKPVVESEQPGSSRAGRSPPQAEDAMEVEGLTQVSTKFEAH